MEGMGSLQAQIPWLRDELKVLRAQLDPPAKCSPLVGSLSAMRPTLRISNPTSLSSFYGYLANIHVIVHLM